MAGIKNSLGDAGWAWAVYEPNEDKPWNPARAGHLYRRAGFGANWGQLQKSLSEGPQRTIDKLLNPEKDGEFERIYNDYESSTGSEDELRAWWLRRMIETPDPLREKMTLFWHGYFAVNANKVKNTRLMQKYLQSLRVEALGSFRVMLESIWRDPAMLIGVGAEVNRKAQPNENLARAMLGAFTVGDGNFSEEDVREAARAFTGWFVLRGRLRYIEREHDEGMKRILGQEGAFAGEDVTRVLLGRLETAKMVVKRLYRWLISESEEPGDELIDPLVKSFAQDYDIRKLVGTMLRSNLFFSEIAYRQRVKCPVEYGIGIVKGLEETVPTTALAKDLSELGQNLYYPPTVYGWAGGKKWIDSGTIVGRENLAWELLKGSGVYGDKLNPWAIAQKYGQSTIKGAGEFLVDLFLDGKPNEGFDGPIKEVQAGDESRTIEQKVRDIAQVIVTLAEFQLA